MPDDFEVLGGLDPLDPEGVNGQDGDLDNDGISNFEEFLNGSRPDRNDTDMDGVTDFVEIGQGSDPANRGDAGMPPKNGTEDLTFVVGDPSGSHSENWQICIVGTGEDADTRRLAVRGKDFGVESEPTVLKLQRFKSYEISVKHLGSDLKFGQADFDWLATMADSSGLTVDSEGVFLIAKHWVVDNTQLVLTTLKMGNEENIVEGKIARLLPVEFITPAGDPVAQPKDAGDGQNEFTFNSAKPGVLEINLKVKVPGIGGMAADIQGKFLFEIDAIGNSQMQWDPANAGGKPTFNGDFITAKVKFTGLPQNNSDFGKKMARIKFDGNKAGEEDFEVFYTGTAKNHQDQANPTYPNWFVYYKQNSGGGAYRYRNAAQSISRPGRGDASIELGNDTYIKNGNFFFETAQQGGRLRLVKEIGGLTSFYTSFVGVLAHEKHHANSETQDRNLDPDGDFISSNFEQNISKTDPADSHSADGAGVYDDSEVYANGPVEKAAVDGADTSKDWANPGSNYGNQN